MAILAVGAAVDCQERKITFMRTLLWMVFGLLMSAGSLAQTAQPCERVDSLLRLVAASLSEDTGTERCEDNLGKLDLALSLDCPDRKHHLRALGIPVFERCHSDASFLDALADRMLLLGWYESLLEDSIHVLENELHQVRIGIAEAAEQGRKKKLHELTDEEHKLIDERHKLSDRQFGLEELYDRVQKARASAAAEDTKASSGGQPCESLFPWPPPQPSARYEIPNDFFGGAKTLGGVNSALYSALEACGYFERSYYCVQPEGGGKGFALVARMEQINEEAFPLPLPDRWSIELKSWSSFSLSEVLKSLFFKKPGYFRIVAFVVYDKPFTSSSNTLTRAEGMRLLHEGANRLSAEIAAIPYSKDYSCTALIYEFEVPESGKEPRQIENSRHSGRVHLERSKLLEALKN